MNLPYKVILPDAAAVDRAFDAMDVWNQNSTWLAHTFYPIESSWIEPDGKGMRVVTCQGLDDYRHYCKLLVMANIDATTLYIAKDYSVNAIFNTADIATEITADEFMRIIRAELKLDEAQSNQPVDPTDLLWYL